MVQTRLLASLPCKSFSSVVIISHHLPPLPIQHSKAHRHIILRRHLHTSAHLHMREGRGIAYGRGGSGARLARAVKMPLLFFPRALAISAVPPARYCSQKGNTKTRADWRKWDESFLHSCQVARPVSLVVEGLRKKIRDVRNRPSRLVLAFLLILGIDERFCFWVRP